MLLQMQISILITPIIGATLNVTRHETFCPVMIQLENSTNPIETEVVCYNSTCCKDGCCSWYHNKLGLCSFIFVFILIYCSIKWWCVAHRHVPVLATDHEDVATISTGGMANCASYDREESILYRSGDDLPIHGEEVRLYTAAFKGDYG